MTEATMGEPTMDGELFRGVVPFVAVAETLSFRAAAARLGLTPAAVSKAVLVLEHGLGVKLLARTTRAVALTPEGRTFLEGCRTAVAAVEGAKSSLARGRAAPHGEVVVSAPFILSTLVATALARLRGRYPRLVARLVVSDRVARLIPDGIDVAVRVGDVDDEGLVARTLGRGRWVIVGAPTYLARRPAPTSRGDLAAHDALVFIGPGGRPRPWQLDDGAFLPTPVLATDHGPSMLDAARAGAGLCQVLHHMVEDDLAAGRLVAVLEGHQGEGPPLRALCAADRRRSANVRAVFEALDGVFGLEPG